MSTKDSLMGFIDAFITGDETAQKQAFSQYSEEKTKEILGSTQPQSVSVEESANILGNDIELDGNTVMVSGKPVARIQYEGEDSNAQMVLVVSDGETIKIKNNDLKELASTIRNKFLGDGQ